MEEGQEDIWNVTQADWDVHKALIYRQLERAIEENRRVIVKLERLKRRLVMPQMAWLNRNLLELDIGSNMRPVPTTVRGSFGRIQFETPFRS